MTTTDFDGKMKQMQTQLKALDVTHDAVAKARLLEASFQLRDELNSSILTITDEYKQTRLQRQMQMVEQLLKKHARKVQQPVQEPQSIELPVGVRPVSQRRSVTSEEVLELIVKKELLSNEVKMTAQELEEVLTRMRNVKQVQQHIAVIIKEQGEDIDTLEQNIDKTFDQVKNANKELDEANKISIATRILKIRLFTGGILAAIGSRLFGFFGLVGGLFAGFRVGSALKE